MDDFDLSEELFEFQQRIQGMSEKYSAITGVTGMSLRVIFRILHVHYNDSMAVFVKRNCDKSQKVNLSIQISDAFRDYKFARSTRYACLSCIRKILGELDLVPELVDAITIIDDKDKCSSILGKVYDCSSESNQHIKERLEKWVTLIREGTKNKSSLSIRNVMSFYVSQCLPKLGIDLNDWPEDAKERVEDAFNNNPELLASLCGDRGSQCYAKKVSWLQFLVTCILKTSVTLSCDPSIYSKGIKSKDDDGSDVHRISSKDLENIYDEVRHDVRTELFFLLMLTTGLRIGGLDPWRVTPEHVLQIKTTGW